MDDLRRSSSSSSSFIVIAFLVWFVIAISSLQIVFVSAEPAENAAKDASKPDQQYWERLKSAINQINTKFFPPDVDFRSIFSPSDKGINEEGKTTAKETVKQAAEKSFMASKKTVEETAKSAAGVAEEAAHVTADKVKNKIPVGYDNDADDSEL